MQPCSRRVISYFEQSLVGCRDARQGRKSDVVAFCASELRKDRMKDWLTALREPDRWSRVVTPRPFLGGKSMPEEGDLPRNSSGATDRRSGFLLLAAVSSASPQSHRAYLVATLFPRCRTTNGAQSRERRLRLADPPGPTPVAPPSVPEETPALPQEAPERPREAPPAAPSETPEMPVEFPADLPPEF